MPYVAGLNFTTEIHVVATSMTKPDLKNLETLDGDAYRLSYWLAVLKALGVTGQEDSGLLSHLKRAAHSMKVTFVYCRSQEETERRKWQLSSRVSVLNETQVLRGWKRALGIVQVSKQLASWSLPATDADVAKWLGQENVRVSAAVVKTCKEIVSRVGSAGLEHVWEEMENVGGVDHPLSKSSTVEKLCHLTKMDRNVPLQNSLLSWVVHTICESMKAKIIASDESREEILLYAKASLLARRIILYVSGKLRAPGKADQQNLKTPEGFYLNFLSHDAYKKSELGSVAADMTWLGKLFGWQLESLPAMKSLIMPPLPFWAALRSSVEKNSQIAAEVALQDQCWRDLVDLSGLLEQKENLS